MHFILIPRIDIFEVQRQRKPKMIMNLWDYDNNSMNVDDKNNKTLLTITNNIGFQT